MNDETDKSQTNGNKITTSARRNLSLRADVLWFSRVCFFAVEGTLPGCFLYMLRVTHTLTLMVWARLVGS